MARQRRLKALLAEAWQRLPELLAARWADPMLRRQWIDAAHAAARERLPAGELQVEMRDDGLRLTSGRVVLDATIPGLLADRLAVEGRLLHFFEGPAP
jgi:hypothetical protein